MTTFSKFLLSFLLLLSILFIVAPASSADNDGEWQNGRSDTDFDPDTWTFEAKAIAVWSEPLLEGQAFKVSPQSFGNHAKVGFRVYVVSESEWKASGQTIGDYIAAITTERHATLLWIGNQIDHDGNTADFWRAGFKPAGWNPNSDGFNRDLHGTDAPLHFFMFDGTVYYSEGATHEPNVNSTRVDNMDAHGYSDPIMFFGLAHKRDSQSNIINAGNAPNSARFEIVSDVNLDNDCDGVPNWDDGDDNDGTCESVENDPAPDPPAQPAPTTTSTTTTTTTTTSTTTTSLPDLEPTTTLPPSDDESRSTTTSTTTTTSSTTTPPDEDPPSTTEPLPPEDPAFIPSPTTTTPEELPTETTIEIPDNTTTTTVGDVDPPEALPSLESRDCNCGDGMPWWFWFIIGNMSWMTVRYIIKHMKEAEEEKEEVASLLDGKEDEEVE